MKGFSDHFRELANKNPDKIALVSCDERGNILQEISYQTLYKLIGEAALFLQSSGLSAGDRIALSLQNSPEFLIVSLAAWCIGVLTVPLDTKRDSGELSKYKTEQSGARRVITGEELAAARSGQNDQVIAWVEGFSHDALILFTSGTTAYPKGALLTLSNLITNAQGIIEWLDITDRDRFSVQLPLHHVNSTTFCLATILAGGSIVIPTRYSNSRFFEQLAATEATYTSVVPSIVFDQLQRKDEYAAVRQNLKLNRIQIGSAPVVAHAVREFINEFHIPLYQGYGQTETALRVTGVPLDLPKNTYAKLVEENSIGTPMRWAQVEIMDERGAMLPENTEGELVVKGPAVMKGYIGGEPAFREGYFLTGDIGHYRTIDGRRFFFLTGRKKEIIIKGGVNISPVAVENGLKEISPDIDQVYCFGVADDRYGEEVAAVVCFKKEVVPEEALRRLKFMLIRGTPVLSAYETPKYLTLLPAADLPTTSTGKVQRTVLRDKIRPETLESIYLFYQSASYKFEMLSVHSPLVPDSLALYNHCWQPLVMDASDYAIFLNKYFTIAAVASDGKVAGQISFSYETGRITCISICSAGYKPRPVPDVQTDPGPKFVETYLLHGHDPVMNFHRKLGAELVEVIPNGRPSDKSSLGYTMLLRYPRGLINLLPDTPVSNQLIGVVRLLADEVGAEVYAVSRPGALAAYIAKHGFSEVSS